MRESIFRGKRKDNGEWSYGDLIQLLGKQGNGRMFIVDNRFGACVDSDGSFVNTEAPFVNEVDPATVGQYTGLKDKNGKEIYEGEICKWFDRTHDWYRNPDGYPGKIIIDTVVFSNGSFRTKKYEELLINQVMTERLNKLEKSEFEVIGNIWDNPNLLEGRDEA